MSDNLIHRTTLSLAKFIDTNFKAPCYVETSDFDFDRKKEGSLRSLPYTSVKFIQASYGDGFQDGNSYDINMQFNVRYCDSNESDMLKGSSFLANALYSGTATASGTSFYAPGYKGIPLYESDSSARTVGVLNVELGEQITFLPTEKSLWNNLKFSSNLSVTLSPIVKELTKDLL